MSAFDLKQVREIADEISTRDECDLFLYNGNISRRLDLEFIELVDANKRNNRCRVMMVTPGGDPDAAYKISRYLQDRYDRFEFFVSGVCKSAGTLVAMGAHELIFAPYGELGPLDVQIARQDNISGLHSGLNISEALQTLERRTFDTYMRLIEGIIQSSGGVVTFSTAAKSASDVVASLYQPIFSQFDPEEIGSRTRSMRIAAEYGKRLRTASENVKHDATRKLAETYPAHGFVIDRAEARALFNNVRDADAREMALVLALGDISRWPSTADPIMVSLTSEEDQEDDTASQAGHPGAGEAAGGDPIGAGQPTSVVPGAEVDDVGGGNTEPHLRSA